MKYIPLVQVCDFQGGSQPPKDQWIDHEKEGYIRMLQIRDFTQPDKDNVEFVRISKTIKTCNEDDILIGRYGASVGKILTGLAGAYNVAIIKTIPDTSKLSKRFLYHYLNSPYFQSFILSVGSRAAQAGFNKDDLSDAQIPDLSLEDQSNIVSQLDKVSGLISLRKEQLAKLDQLVKSLFIELFGDPVTNPKGWDMPLIEDVVANEKNALKAGPFGSALKKEYYVSSGYKIYGQEQVISGDHTFGDYYIDEERYKILENCAVQAGDVLISLVGTYGKLLVMPEGFEPGIINPRLMKITFDKSRVNPYYFQHYFQSDSLKKALAENTHGGTMDILNLGIVRKLAMPLPPLVLQNEFISFVEQTDKSKLAIQQSLDKLELLKKSLMQEYFG